MNWGQLMTDTALVERIGWALLHSLWQIAIIAIILFGVLALLRRSSANARYLVSCFAMLLMAVTPIVTFAVIEAEPATTLAVEFTAVKELVTVQPVESHHSESIVVEADIPQPAESLAYEPERVTEPVLEQITGQLEPALPWLVCGWLVGVVVFSLRLMCSWFRARSLTRRNVSPLGEHWTERLSELSRRLGLRRGVCGLESAVAHVPMVIGHLKPVLLLPISAITGLTTDQLTSIIAHELAHVRRWDYLANLLQSVIEVLMFYHPAVWWTGKCIRVERENCCDDMAAGICGDRALYASALAKMVEISQSTPHLAAAADGGKLLARIRRLLAGTQNQTEQTRSLAGVLTLILLVCIAIAAAVAIPACVSEGINKADMTGSISSDSALTYHFGRNMPAEFNFDPERQGQIMELVETLPEDVSLPKLRYKNPIIAKYHSPLATNGFLWCVMDCPRWSFKDARLYIDTDDDGQLIDETPVAPFKGIHVTVGYSYWFEPVKLTFGLNGKRHDYHVRFWSWTHMTADPYERENHLHAITAGWYSGEVQVGGKSYKCSLLDNNANGVFDDSSTDLGNTDRIFMQSDEGLIEHYAGKYIRIDGKLFSPTISDGGRDISFEPAEYGQAGTVRVPANLQQFTTGGPNGRIDVKLIDGVGVLPAGEHRIHSWRIEKTDEDGNLWQAAARKFRNAGVFTMLPDQDISLPIAEPITATIEPGLPNGLNKYWVKVRCRLDARITITRNGEEQLPRVRVTNPDGSYDRTLKVRIDGDGDRYVTLTPPSDRPGPFTAVVVLDGPFDYQPKPYVFSAKQSKPRSRRLVESVRQVFGDVQSRAGNKATTMPSSPGRGIYSRGVPRVTQFYVSGEVSRPGTYALTGQKVTIKQALTAAGYKFDKPGMQAIIFRRNDDSNEVRLEFDVDALVAGKLRDSFLQPDDTVLLQQREEVKLAVEVARRLEADQSLRELRNTEIQMMVMLDNLTTKFGDTHREVKSVEANLASIREEIATREKRIAQKTKASLEANHRPTE